VSPPATPPAEPASATPTVNTAPRSRRRIDLARIAVALKDRSQQIFISAGALAAVAFLAGYFLSNYHARVTLVARDASTGFVAGLEGEPYRPQQLAPATLVSLMESPELADLRHSFVVRHGNLLPVDFHRLLHEWDMSQNIYLQPDDFVYVPSSLSREVYVLGAVKSPRALHFADRMTLVSAMANASGPMKYDFLARADAGPFTKDAYLSHVAIVRGSLATPQIAVVDYNDIVKGSAPDVRLEPGDIIFVPNSPYTTLKRYLNMIVNTFVTTVAANEGIRAGGGDVAVGVSVGVGER
jgi:protein involved in polysaccharide export with SLBB domain